MGQPLFGCRPPAALSVLARILAISIYFAAGGALISRETPTRVAVMIGEEEYLSATTLPRFFADEFDRAEFALTYLHVDPDDGRRFPGLEEALSDAELLVMSVRRKTLPVEQLAAVRQYLERGGPLVAIRTASHAFALRSGEPPEGHATWQEFDREILGADYEGHFGRDLAAKVALAPSAGAHPILKGISGAGFPSSGTLYRSRNLGPATTVLLIGWVVEEAGERRTEPVAWVNEAEERRVFYTSLGHPGDFEVAAFRKMLRNAIDWALGRPIRESAK